MIYYLYKLFIFPNNKIITHIFLKSSSFYIKKHNYFKLCFFM